ncbi:rubredoxin-NAD(+) reductase, partial [Gluconobacter japonicus]
TLRQEGFAGTITMVTEEKYRPYDRTALSKTVLLSEPEKAHAPSLRSESFYGQNRISVKHGRIAAFDPATRMATLSDGSVLTADHVLIATGSRSQMLDLPGADLKRVFTLHSEKDAEDIARVIDPDQAVTIIGAGFIGLEVASCLRQRGVGVTIIADTDVPMEKHFGREIGMRLRQLHEDNGVAFISDAKAVKIYGDKKAEGVELDDGMKL